jgi:hypothetical protein
LHTHERRKTLQIKIKDANPFNKSTRQMRTQVDTTERENKSKQSTKQKKTSGKDPMQRELKTTK